MAYDPDLCEEAIRLGSSTLYEALGRATAAVDPAIRPVWEGAAVAGPAYPLECAPGDNLAIHLALEKAPRGSVLVVACSGFVAGYWGEVLTVAAEAAGVIGLIMDGGVRDVAALRAHQFPVFSRGITMRGTHKACAPSVGEALSLAGTPVAPGDLVVADDDGVLVVPADAVPMTMEKSRARAAKEDTFMADLKAGATTLDLLGLSKWRDA